MEVWKKNFKKVLKLMKQYKKTISIFMITFIIVMVGICSIAMTQNDHESKVDQKIQIQDKNITDERYVKNKNINEDYYGWLSIDGTNIDVPVMYKDNSYYLNHTFDRKEDIYGTPFIDEKCNINERSTNLLIHGHSTVSGPIHKMFDDLFLYKDPAFYKEHPYIELQTKSGVETYEIMAVMEARVLYQHEEGYRYYQFIDVQSDEDLQEHIKAWQTMSLYETGVSASYGDEFITLSTCDTGRENGRFVMIAKKIT